MAYYDYQKSVKYYLVPAFGIVYLSDLTRSDVKAWAAGLTVSQKRISNLLIPLRAMFAEAYEEDLIEKNPLFGLTIKRKGGQRPEAEPFTPTEIKRLLTKATGQVRNFIQFWVWTGLRTGEISALRQTASITRQDTAGSVRTESRLVC